MTTHPILTGTSGTPGTTLKDNGKLCPGTKNAAGTAGTITAEDLAARVAALAARMRADPVPGASVPAVPASKSVPGQTIASNINAVPLVPAVPAQNGKADLSRAVPTAGQDRPSAWWSPSGPLEGDPTRTVERAPTTDRRDRLERLAGLFIERAGHAKAAAFEPSDAQADALAFADLLHDWRQRAPKLTEADARARLILALRDAHALGLLDDVDVDALAAAPIPARMEIGATFDHDRAASTTEGAR